MRRRTRSWTTSARVLLTTATNARAADCTPVATAVEVGGGNDGARRRPGGHDRRHRAGPASFSRTQESLRIRMPGSDPCEGESGPCCPAEDLRTSRSTGTTNSRPRVCGWCEAGLRRERREVGRGSSLGGAIAHVVPVRFGRGLLIGGQGVVLVVGAALCLSAYRLMMRIGRLPVERRILA